jgi:hypothetical protein
VALPARIEVAMPAVVVAVVTAGFLGFWNHQRGIAVGVAG